MASLSTYASQDPPAGVYALTLPPQVSPLLDLMRQRDALMDELEAVPMQDDDFYEAEAARLCGEHDALGARMIEHPICNLADALAKLSVVDELYSSALHMDGHDLVLFGQVMDWLKAFSGTEASQ